MIADRPVIDSCSEIDVGRPGGADPSRASEGMTARQSRRMLVLCPYPVGVAAGQRLKFEQYYDDWRAMGWEVDVAPFMDPALWAVIYKHGHFASKLAGVARGYLRRARDLLRVPRYDLVYCHMSVTPIGTSIAERLTRTLASKLVYDIEDNVMALFQGIGQNHPNPVVRFLRGGGKYRYLVREADHVVTSSPAANEHCRAINRAAACTYVSSSLDADRFQPACRYSNDGVVTIGWTGTFSTRRYLDLLRGVFQKLATMRRFRLRVIGNFDYDLPGVDLEVIRWTAESEIEDLQGIDIGVYPLTVDDWVSGKSGLKAIQYMMMALPCVATSVGTTPLIIRDGENGLLATTQEEWLDALTRLLDDPELRRRIGEAARRDAVAKYSTKAIAAEYRRVLGSVMERRC
jgi:glycosyltransferase involved in cell wall biosynthesis